MLFEENKIKTIQSDDSIGAGNFIHKLLEYSTDPDATCIYQDKAILDHNGKLKSEFSLNEIVENANYWSNLYYSQGIKKREPVCLYLNDNFNYFIHYLALNQIGAIPVCINHNLSTEVTAEFIKRIGSKVLITEQSINEQAESIRHEIGTDFKVLRLELLLIGESIDFKTEFNHNDDDVVLLAHTSGTTGIPKGVIFTHNSLYFGVKEQLHKQVGTRILSSLPHSHSSAISVLMSSLMRGATVYIQSKREPKEIESSVASFKPDMVVAFPKTFVDLCRVELNAENFDSVSYWLSTGDANHEPHIRKLVALGNCTIKGEKLAGSIFIDNLGSSEFGFAMFRNIHTPKSNNYKRYIGKPFDWVQAEVLDEHGNALEPNEVGMLGVLSESVTVGYWNNHLLTEQNKVNGYWLTGDYVYKNKVGEFFHVDRISDKLETREGPMYSCQVEELILGQYDCIFECSIIGVPDGGQYQKAVLLVEPKSGCSLRDTLLQELNEMLVKENIPTLSAIKLEPGYENIGATGKKLKRVLRESVSI
ncbi:class I adenylate-forming enzyme family protein [Pseudoalteromonas sp. OOF1S-7]|uniref:class I adenylate-forming enzyme family protein n=1 Tax=Pseudoalteromonas sp. OOF1S-7 TaxID=2917757 RepID=UPI001EF72504|nr:class I adenylate-forming enzyme family protein [Pseudoalteromonas sp. OOF1S-7]MCG7534596.1 acyl--CoA ligase [Pseudoalteromonas sp. OOF1S-7]